MYWPFSELKIFSCNSNALRCSDLTQFEVFALIWIYMVNEKGLERFFFQVLTSSCFVNFRNEKVFNFLLKNCTNNVGMTFFKNTIFWYAVCGKFSKKKQILNVLRNLSVAFYGNFAWFWRWIVFKLQMCPKTDFINCLASQREKNIVIVRFWVYDFPSILKTWAENNEANWQSVEVFREFEAIINWGVEQSNHSSNGSQITESLWSLILNEF